MKKYIVIALLFFTGFSYNKVTAQPPSKEYQLLFEDNFQGNTVNENEWSYRLDRRQGGSFNALNLKENVFVSDGFLHITVRQDTINGIPENTGGGLISKRQFGYGYYETLSKPFMAGTGVHSAFWQAGGSDPKIENRIFEIDSYEIDSKTYLGDNNLYIHICPKDFSEVPWPHRAKVPMSYREDGWLLDAFEYTPEGVIFYDNGKIVARAEWNNLTAAQKVWLTALNGFGKIEKDKQPGETLFDYFRYYAKDYPGVNILPNGNFEYNQDKVNPEKPVAWYQSGTSNSGTIVLGDAFTDRYFLRQGSESVSFKSVTNQKLECIMNGNYQLSARVRSSGGQKNAGIRVYGFGGEDISLNIDQSKSWSEIQIPKIEVINNQVIVEFYSEGEAGQWLDIDDVKLMKPALSNQKVQEPEPFALIGDPIWHLAKREPIVFSGDDKFYFFDRNVGYGDAVTISFRIQPDIKANMTPIARMPKEGKSGWAVQLTEDGGINFRIGSQADHFCLSAPNIFTAGKENLITCIFNKGVAEIFIDGKIVAVEKGINYSTIDKTAVGRLGDTQTNFQSIAEVFIPDNTSSKSDSKSQPKQKFKGKIRDVRIYNRALSDKEMEQFVKM